jgi:hypothetical protein
MDATLTLKGDGGAEITLTDEVLFTHYGISGPLALKASRKLAPGMASGRLNYLPGNQREQALAILQDRRERLADRPAEFFLTGFLPERLGRLMIGHCGINVSRACREIADPVLSRLAGCICQWPVEIKGPRPFREAQVTAGGVDCRQVFPASLMSKKAPGLFFCGEILDVDGDTGGYNLQWCWSSGYLAGKAAAEYVKHAGGK